MSKSADKDAVNLETRIEQAKYQLDIARFQGDQLKIDLAQNALNDLLDRYRVTVVTRNQEEQP